MSRSLAVLFGLLTASANAFAVMLQHVASTSGERRGWRWVRDVLRHPLWMLGWLGMLASLVFQAIALHFGPMSLVQPLLVSELVIALVVRRVWRRQRLSRLAWLSAVTTGAALATALAVMDPRGHATVPGSSEWIGALLITAAVVGGLLVAARGAGPARRAASFATATAVLWALEATFIKSATDILVGGGVGGLVSSWTLYALIVTGVGGLITEQLALREGPLRVSQPLIVIVDPLASVLYGIGLFHERLSATWGPLVVGVVAVAVMCVGVVVMTRVVPETLVPGALPHVP